MNRLKETPKLSSISTTQIPPHAYPAYFSFIFLNKIFPYMAAKIPLHYCRGIPIFCYAAINWYALSIIGFPSIVFRKRFSL